MENVLLRDIVSYTRGSISENVDGSQKISFIANDSRRQGENWVYLAIRGERLDGHDFVIDAYQNGAVASIVEKPTERGIVVENTYQALKDIAIGYKSRFEIPFVAVTGSSGKTTTKDMIYYALSATQNTLRNEGNLNSEIGLPMTLLNLEQSHECAVLEMGMYHLGEIDYLADIVRPHIGVITNVGTAHIVHLKTRENIRKAKLEIANYMQAGDFLLLNGDNDMLAALDFDELKPQVITFGLSRSNDIYPIEYTFLRDSTRGRAKVLDEEVDFEIPTLGEHNILNALSALGVCKLLSLNLRASAEGLAQYQPSRHRMEKREIGDKLIIDDSYNANPDSMRAALSTLDYAQGGRKVAVLADMLELGENSAQYHFDVGVFAANRLDLLIGIGEMAKEILRGAESAGFRQEAMVHFENNEAANAVINRLLNKGDTILLKGSRGMKLEEVADSIC